MKPLLADMALHETLIGATQSRSLLNTPVLVLDVDALDRNIRKMAALAASKGVVLRPHAKTHKSLDIGRRQIAAGAVGLCCAKIGEAEALAASGEIPNILVTSPVVARSAIARLVALRNQMGQVLVAVDHPDNVRALARASSVAQPLEVLIDVDPGILRTGVTSLDAAVALADVIMAEPTLRLRGVQFYCGAHQHIEGYADRRAGVVERTEYLASIVAALRSRGAEIEIISGGGTGTHLIDLEFGLFTELQVGSYVFMDRQYTDCDLAGDGGETYEVSLFVDSRVVSANTPGLVTIDAGFKSLSTDGGTPRVVSGAPRDAVYHFMGDEHGALVGADVNLTLADLVSLQVPHCDPTVNLYDAYHVVRDGMLVDIWPVTARGRSR